MGGSVSDLFQPFDEVAPTGFRGVAAQLGLAHAESAKDRGYQTELPAGIPMHLPLLADADPMRHISDILYGSFAGYDVQMFTYNAVAFRDEPGRQHRTCLLFTLPTVFPLMTIGPHNRLSASSYRGVNPRSFEGRYRVVTRDPALSPLLLDDGLQSYLAGLEDWRFELSRNVVLGHVAAVEPTELPALLTTMFGLVIRIPDAALEKYNLAG
jgi:hypothetical protein